MTRKQPDYVSGRCVPEIRNVLEAMAEARGVALAEIVEEALVAYIHPMQYAQQVVTIEPPSIVVPRLRNVKKAMNRARVGTMIAIGSIGLVAAGWCLAMLLIIAARGS